MGGRSNWVFNSAIIGRFNTLGVYPDVGKAISFLVEKQKNLPAGRDAAAIVNAALIKPPLF